MPSAKPNRAIPIGRPMAMSDPNARSRMTTAADRPISSPMPVGASSNAKNRSPPISIRSGEPSRASTPSSLRLSRSAPFSSSITGYWTRTRATRPSGETDPLAAAAAGPAASAPAGSLVPSTLGSSATAAWTSVNAARAAAESKKVTPSSSGAMTTCAVSPAVSDRAARQQVGCCLGVEPRHLEGVLEIPAEGSGRSDHQHGDGQPGSDDDPGAPGGEPAHPIQGIRHRGVPSVIVG